MELTIEEVKALYFNKAYLVEPDYKLFRLDGGSIRYYCELTDGNLRMYPSTTSICKKILPTDEFLRGWYFKFRNEEDMVAELRRTGLYGSFLHERIADFLITGHLDLRDEYLSVVYEEYIERNYREMGNFVYITPQEYIHSLYKKDILAFVKFAEDYKLEPIAVEVPLCKRSGILPYAGTLDIICRLNFPKLDSDKIYIGDFKSGKKGFYPNSELQLHLNKELLIENSDVLDVSVFNWSPKEWLKEPGYNFKIQDDSVEGNLTAFYLEIFKQKFFSPPKNHLLIKGIYEKGSNTASDLYNFIEINDYIINYRRKNEFQTTRTDNPQGSTAEENPFVGLFEGGS